MTPVFGTNPPQGLITHVPHAERLGMHLVELGAGFAVIRLPYAPELVGDPERGVVFGGAITTLLDQCSGLAVFCAVAEIRSIATLDLRIDYLRAAKPGRDLIGRAECYKLTTNVAFVRAAAWEDNESDPFASCHASFMLGANATTSPLALFIASMKKQPSERSR